MDQDDIPARDAQSAPQHSQAGVARKFLTKAFNAVAKIGVGAVFGFAAKTSVLAVAATATAPALAAAIAAGAAGGLASSLAKHALENRKLKKAGQETVKYNWKRQGLLSVLLGAAGGGIAAHFSDSISHAISNAIDYIKGPSAADTVPAPAPVAALPVEPAKPIVGACLDDPMKTLVNADGASEKVHEAATRACSGNARASAQAMKDLGYHAYNGIGMEKSQKLGVEMLTKAAEAGNVQAIRDLAYIEFHGNEAAGVPKNVEAALTKMESVMHKDKLAMRLMKEWTAVTGGGAEHAVPASAPAPVPTPAPLDDLTHVELPPPQPVVTVTVDEAAPAAESSAPVAVPPAAAPAAQEAGQTISSGNSAPCRAVFHANGVDFHCPVDNNEIVLGDTITIQRPPLLMPVAR
ncbi:MAG: SEL1-like repeat protein [Micavibrio aeruginosavorus]|nr:SEL1-like repeat protein [Micavibrio aeruginosavorus]